MKKIFLLFLLFSFTFLNAQKYLFTTFVKYFGHSSNSKRESIIFTNSNSDSYYLQLLKFESSFTAILYDYENRKMHKFIVTESETKGNTSFKFDYQNTTNFFVPNNYEFSKYAYDFQTLELNDSIRKVKFTIYKNSRKKKIIRNYDNQT